LGMKMEIDPEKVLDFNRSLQEGAVLAWSANPYSWSLQYLTSVAQHYGLDPATPLREASPEQIEVILYGTKGEKVPVVYRSEDGQEWRQEARFEGIINNLARRYRETNSESMRREIQENYMTFRPCLTCHGARLRRESLAVTVSGKNISELTAMSVSVLRKFLRE